MKEVLIAVLTFLSSPARAVEHGSSLVAPFGLSWVEYVWVIAISSWGGVVSWVGKAGKAHRFSLVELIGEITTSAFSGILVFLACQSTNMNATLTACMVGVAGHMGARTMFFLERGVGRALSRMFGSEGYSNEAAKSDTATMPRHRDGCFDE